MKLRVGAASDIGQARERNEDSFLADHPLYVVADGMGGARGGAEASSLAVEVLSGMEDPSQLAERVREANRVVFDRQAGDRRLSGMGTTITAVMADDSTLHLAHVGDSRAYLLRDGGLQQLTEDHTLVQRMVSEGKITEEEAQNHPQRNVITRVVGPDPDVDVDEETLDAREGDRFLLCTDGLTAMMREESMQEILEANPDPQQAAQALVDAANRAGGLDNITVVVLDFAPGDGVELLSDSGGGAAGAAPLSGPSPTPLRDTGRPDGTSTATRPDDTTAIPAAPSEGEPPRRGWVKPVLWIGIALVVIAAGLTAFRMYLDTQWYVGVEDGHVAVFRGLPADILGFELSSAVSKTRIPASAAAKLEPYSGIHDGLTVGSEQEANQLVDNIRQDVLAQQRQHQPPKKKNSQSGGGG